MFLLILNYNKMETQEERNIRWEKLGLGNDFPLMKTRKILDKNRKLEQALLIEIANKQDAKTTNSVNTNSILDYSNSFKEFIVNLDVTQSELQTDPLPRNPYAGLDYSKIPDPLSIHPLYKLIKRPAKAPVDRNTTFFTDVPYYWSGGDETFTKQKPFDKLGSYFGNLGFVPYDLKKSPSGIRWNEFTESKNYFNFTAILDEKNLINLMLGNYIRGTGPTNYVFPINGIISKYLLGSKVLSDAFSSWKNAELEDKFHEKIEFSLLRLKELTEQEKIVSLENFIGSVDITINWTSAETIIVRIYNVTSITSGDLTKHFPGVTWMPSVVRDPNEKDNLPYSNIFQIYQLSFRRYKMPNGFIQWIAA